MINQKITATFYIHLFLPASPKVKAGLGFLESQISEICMFLGNFIPCLTGMYSLFE